MPCPRLCISILTIWALFLKDLNKVPNCLMLKPNTKLTLEVRSKYMLSWKEWMCVCHFPKSLHKVDTYTEGWWSNCTMTQKVNWQNLIESFLLAWQELFYNVFKKSFTPSSIKLHYQPINCVVKSNYPHNNRWELAILSDIKWSRKSVVLIRMLIML